MKAHVNVSRVKVADQLAPLRAAWETVGQRGAVLEALRLCRPGPGPLPEWLGRAVEEAVGWWVREAVPSGTHGRHARPATTRREQVRHLDREAFYRMELGLGRTPEEARAITAEWCRCDERTVSNSLARVKRMTPAERYLGPDDRAQQWWYRLFMDPKHAEERQRLRELHEQFAPRVKTR